MPPPYGLPAEDDDRDYDAEADEESRAAMEWFYEVVEPAATAIKKQIHALGGKLSSDVCRVLALDPTFPVRQHVVRECVRRMRRKLRGIRADVRYLEGELSKQQPGKILARRRSPNAVTRMKELRAQGLSYEAIAMKMNDEGSRNAYGREWTRKAVQMAISPMRNGH